jgi:hypothetical protein
MPRQPGAFCKVSRWLQLTVQMFGVFTTALMVARTIARLIRGPLVAPAIHETVTVELSKRGDAVREEGIDPSLGHSRSIVCVA